MNLTKTYVVLLRAVTPTGKNKVPLAQLREILTDAGFDGVRTYIQSGNILMRTALSAKEVETRVHELIKDRLGPDLVVVARTAAQLQKTFRDNPFQQPIDTTKVFFAFFAQSPSPQNVKELLGLDYGDQKLAIIGETAYMYIPGLFGRGKLNGSHLEKRLGVPVTVRNFNTTSKLVELSKE